VIQMGSKPEYLLDARVPITYAPSATLLMNLSQRQAVESPEGRNPILSAADPAYSQGEQVASAEGALQELSARSRYGRIGGALARLPYSAQESDWLKDNFKGAGLKVTQLLGQDATEANLRKKMSGRKVLHLACHGLMDQAYGNLFGALALTPGEDASDP